MNTNSPLIFKKYFIQMSKSYISHSLLKQHVQNWAPDHTCLNLLLPDFLIPENDNSISSSQKFLFLTPYIQSVTKIPPVLLL